MVKIIEVMKDEDVVVKDVVIEDMVIMFMVMGMVIVAAVMMVFVVVVVLVLLEINSLRQCNGRLNRLTSTLIKINPSLNIPKVTEKQSR